MAALGTATAALGTATAALGTATAATTRDTVATRAMEVLKDMERVTEDLEGMEGLDFHLTASEEVMVELAPTPMVVQVLYMECQVMGGRGDTTHRLQPMVPNLLPMIHNLLLMMHLLLLKQLQPIQQPGAYQQPAAQTTPGPV